MKIGKVTCREISIPLKFRFSQSNNKGASGSSSVLLELLSENGTSGFGESCPRIYVTEENFESVQKDLSRIMTRLLSVSIYSLPDVKEFMEEMAQEAVGPSTLCAVELGLIDLLSKTSGTALPDLFDEILLEPLRYSLVLPLSDSDALIHLLHQIRHFRPPSIKLKVDHRTQHSLTNLEITRETFGADCPIRVDVNGGWALDDALKCIPLYLDRGISSFEQPLAVGKELDMQILTREYGEDASIMADESLLTLAHAENMISHQICNHFNLKISKMGGFFRTLAIYNLAYAHGIPCQLGAHFGETSILTAAGAILAQVSGNLTALEGALGTLLLEKDLVDPSMQQDQSGIVPVAENFRLPGLTSEINLVSVKDFTIKSISWPEFS